MLDWKCTVTAVHSQIDVLWFGFWLGWTEQMNRVCIIVLLSLVPVHTHNLSSALEPSHVQFRLWMLLVIASTEHMNKISCSLCLSIMQLVDVNPNNSFAFNCSLLWLLTETLVQREREGERETFSILRVGVCVHIKELYTALCSAL